MSRVVVSCSKRSTPADESQLARWWPLSGNHDTTRPQRFTHAGARRFRRLGAVDRPTPPRSRRVSDACRPEPLVQSGDSVVGRPCHVSVTKLARTPNQRRARMNVSDPRRPDWRCALRFDLRTQEADSVGCAEVRAVCIHDCNTATEDADVAGWVLRVGVLHAYPMHRPARPQNREWLTPDTHALVRVTNRAHQHQPAHIGCDFRGSERLGGTRHVPFVGGSRLGVGGRDGLRDEQDFDGDWFADVDCDSLR